MHAVTVRTQAFTWSRLPFCDGVPPSVWSAAAGAEQDRRRYAEQPGAPREHHAAAAVPLQSHGALVSVVHGGEGPVEGGGQLLPRSAHPGCLSVLSGRWLDSTAAGAAAGAPPPASGASPRAAPAPRPSVPMATPSEYERWLGPERKTPTPSDGAARRAMHGCAPAEDKLHPLGPYTLLHPLTPSLHSFTPTYTLLHSLTPA